MKFKVGDRVKVINCKARGRECENLEKIFTIKSIDKNGNRFPYELYGTPEFFGDDELELVNKFTKSDLKDGDKCTLKNGQVVFVDKTSDYRSNYSFESIDEQLRYFNDDVSIVKVERPVKYETLFERKEEILDETEKKYLASVIRPFRNKVEAIRKEACNKEFISIELKDEASINFPYFKKGTMYKGMKKHKKYTLKELGL